MAVPVLLFRGPLGALVLFLLLPAVGSSGWCCGATLDFRLDAVFDSLWYGIHGSFPHLEIRARARLR